MTPDLSPAILMLWTRFKSLTPEQRGDAPEIVLKGWGYGPLFGPTDIGREWSKVELDGDITEVLQADDLDAALWRLRGLVAWEAGIEYCQSDFAADAPRGPGNGEWWFNATPSDWIAEAAQVVGRMEK